MATGGIVKNVYHTCFFAWVTDKGEENQNSIKSPTFSSVFGNMKLDWQLELQEKLVDSGSSLRNIRKPRLSLIVHFLSSDAVKSSSPSCKVSVKVLLLDNDFADAHYNFFPDTGETEHDSATSLIKGSGTVSKPGDKILLPCQCHLGWHIMTRFKLRVECKIMLDGSSINFEKQTCHVCDDLGAMLSNQKSCDITLKAEGREIKAHKAILAARSTVFTAMFEHNMKESLNQEVLIEDIKFGVLQEMLWHIYTGKVKNMRVVFHDLLIAADKYDLQALKSECEKEFSECLSKENCIQSLILADRHSSSHLLSVTTDFILENVSDLMSTAEWDSLEKHDPRLIAQLFRHQVFKKPRVV